MSKYAFSYLFLACEASFTSYFHYNASPPLSPHDLSGVDIMPTCRDNHVKKPGNIFRVYVTPLSMYIFQNLSYKYNLMLYSKDIG